MAGRKRIGLALSGGVARGAAHLGVLEVLQGAAIPIDVVAGASAGALVGALYCAGCPLARMEDLLAHFGWGKIASLVWPRQGLVSFAKMAHWLTEIIGDLNFADLRLPLAVVATELQSGESVTLQAGRVAPAVQASCAVPGFVEPVQVDGQFLCDGGVSCNLPSAAARALGAEYVIGVDLFQHHIRRHWGALGFGFAAFENLVRRSGGGLEVTDCLITPELAGSLYVNFGDYRELIAKGARAAEAALPAIRAALQEGARRA